MPTRPPSPAANPRNQVVVVHGGARDAYQVAQALAEANLLHTLVTDLFFPADRPWARALAARLPRSLQTLLRARSNPNLPSSLVRNCLLAGLQTLALDRLPRVPFALRRGAIRRADATQGRTAGKIASKTGAHLLAYSYFAYDAFRAGPRPGILFQAHPHPLTIRRILTEELALHPDCAPSLNQEWELALPEDDFRHLVDEPALAAHFLCASTFTRLSLIENGADPAHIQVVPYGVDLNRFHPSPTRRATPGSPLQLLFVGRINQRKGIKYLLEALRLLNSPNVHLTVCGRVVDSLDLFQPFAGRVTLRPSVSPAELVAAYQSADLFVLPSVAEGFGQVLLEALASGLPILSTPNTAAPDLLTGPTPGSGPTHCNEGYLVPPRRADLLAQAIDHAATRRPQLAQMSLNARQRATHFTPTRFRQNITTAVQTFLKSPNP